MARFTTTLWSINWPICFLVQSELVLKQSASSFCSHFVIMRPSQHLTFHQQPLATWYLTIARFQTGCSQTEVATELRVSECHQQIATERRGRVTERHTSRHTLATSHTDYHFIVNTALRNQMMNATQLQAHLREVRGTQVPLQTIWNHLHQHGLPARWPEMVPSGTGVIVLNGPGRI